MLIQRSCRALSAFNRSTRRWVRVPLSTAQKDSLAFQDHALLSPDVKRQMLSLVSWNIDAFTSRPVIRSRCILDSILQKSQSPDIIFFQEVTTDVRNSLLNDERIRTRFIMTDAEDLASFKDVPFTTMTLLSKELFVEATDGGIGLTLKGVFRVALPSKFGRDGLCVEIAHPAASGTVVRFINTHLDSLDSLSERTEQMIILASVLRERGCAGGIIAGDFNSVSPEDHELVAQNGLVDAWVALGKSNGATWGVGTHAILKDGLQPKRLDKVAMLGVEVKTMEILYPDSLELPRPLEPPVYKHWSDHCGLSCTIAV